MGEPLPDLLRGLFWDQDFGALRWPEHAEAVTSRVLSSGESEELRWLRERVTDDELRAFLRARRGRGLERRQIAYWGLALDLPEEEVAGWLRWPGRRVWDERASR